MDQSAVVEIPEVVRRFLAGPHIGTLATVSPSGAPHQAAVWYRLDPDGRVLVNSRDGRLWPANLRRDARCSLSVIDAADGYRWVGLECRVETIVDDVETARDDIVGLADRYGGAKPATIAAFRSQQRISFHLVVVRIHDHLGG